MPTPAIKSFADQSGKSVGEVEKLWDKAKEAAKEQGRAEEYDYITGILKKMLGLSEKLAEQLVRLYEQTKVDLHIKKEGEDSWLAYSDGMDAGFTGDGDTMFNALKELGINATKGIEDGKRYEVGDEDLSKVIKKYKNN